MCIKYGWSTSSLTPFTVKQKVFTNKAFAFTCIQTEVKLIGLAKNVTEISTNPTEIQVETWQPTATSSVIQIDKIEEGSGKVSIADAEVVVSGGRGLKGPENWQLIENLADVLGAATACSKPVSDMSWRPHVNMLDKQGNL